MAEPAAAAPLPNCCNVDPRVPGPLRDLLAEADGCGTMGFLLGGTVCAQRAVQALLALEGAEGESHDARLHRLGEKHPFVPKVLLAVCSRFGEPRGDVHSPLDGNRLMLLTVALKLLVYEVYVIARERADGLKYVQQILERLEGENETARPPGVVAFGKQPPAKTAHQAPPA